MIDHLSEKHIKAARLMGISNDEMFERLQRMESDYIFPVAIIIPVYNCEKYIRESIESAINQTVPCEVIVVNDGSTDGTHDVCKSINSITYLIKPNGGTASALNCGIRNSHCKWVHWLSADDVLYPNAVENMLKEISTTPNNKNYIYYSNYDTIDESSNIIGEFVEPLHRNFLTKEERFAELLGNYYGNGSSSMIHKSVFDDFLFDESLPYFEDYDFWLKCMDNGMDLKLIPLKTLKYRRHSEQMTNKCDNSLAEVIRSKYR